MAVPRTNGKHVHATCTSAAHASTNEGFLFTTSPPRQKSVSNASTITNLMQHSTHMGMHVVSIYHRDKVQHPEPNRACTRIHRHASVACESWLWHALQGRFTLVQRSFFHVTPFTFLLSHPALPSSRFYVLSFVLAFLLLHPLFFCLRCLPFPPGSTCIHDTKSQSCFKPHQDVPTWHGSPIHSSLCLLSCRWHSVALRPAAVPWSRDWVDRSWVHATSAATVHSSYDVHAQIMKKTRFQPVRCGDHGIPLQVDHGLVELLQPP